MGLFDRLSRGVLRPEARDDAYTLNENDSTTVAPLQNDAANAPGYPYARAIVYVDQGDFLGTVEVVDNRAHLKIDPGSAYDYLGAGETATATIIYGMQNAFGYRDRAEITLTITGQNDAPDAQDVTGSVSEDGSAIIAADFTDPDTNDTHTLSFGEATGSVTDNGDGTFTYDPNGQFEYLHAGETATDSFSYTVDDGHGGVSTATATVTIEGADDDATISGDTTGAVTEDEGTPASGTLTISDRDAGDEVFRPSASQPDAVGATIIYDINGVPASYLMSTDLGQFGLNLNSGEWGFSLFDSDPAVQALAQGETLTRVMNVMSLDGSAEETITVTITGANDAPVAVDDGAITDEDTPITILAADLLANDQDVDGDALSIGSVSATSALGASVSIDGMGNVVYDPTGLATLQELSLGQVEVDTFTYDISDGQGGTDTATVRVRVDGANDAPVGMDDAIGGETFIPLGSDIQVNTETTGRQINANVAALADGGFVVTWQSEGQDGSDWGVYGQLYDASGMAVGGEFRINTHTTDSQRVPSVAALEDGGFVVTWASLYQDGVHYGIYAQRYDADGAEVGTEFRVNTETASGQSLPSVAALDGGGFVVTWSSSGQDGSGWGIYGQRYDASGAQVGPEFRVNTTTNSFQLYSSVAVLEGGGFVVTWSGRDQDGSDYGIYGQLYDASGAAQGGEFLINTETSNYQIYSTVAALEGGGFVVTWSSDSQDGSGFGVYGQRYDASGAKVGSEFAINTTTNSQQLISSVAAFEGGGFVVTWQSLNQDGSGWGIYGQRYDASGTAISGEFRLNSITAGDQASELYYGGTATAVLDDGTIVSGWSGTTGPEEVFVRLFAPALSDEDTAATIQASDLLANDSDVEGDMLSIGSVSGTSAMGAAVSIDGSGNVVYDPTGSATLQALAAGETATDSFTYTAFDGTDNSDPVTVTFTVTGVNDPASISGEDTGSVTEDGTLTDSGVLTVSDVDSGEASFQAVSAGDLAGVYGDFTFNEATGAWDYTLRNGDANVQALNTGDAVTDTLTINSFDGAASQDIVVTINGADEPAPLLLDFDDVAVPGDYLLLPSGYGGFEWNDKAYVIRSELYNDTGYQAGAVSGTQVAFNASGAPLSFTRATDFDFVGGYFTGAYNDGLEVTVRAYDDGVLTATDIFTVDTSGPVYHAFTDPGFDSIDQVVISTSDISLSQVAIDDLSFIV